MDNCVNGSIEERRDGADSPDSESIGEARAQMCGAVQVHAPAQGEHYLEMKDEDRESSSSSSSSSSSDDEEHAKAVDTGIMTLEEPVVQVEEVNGDAHDRSRRSSSSSSSSSASSDSPGDPCDDPPIQARLEDEDRMLEAHTEPVTANILVEEAVDHSVATLELVTLDEPSRPSLSEVTLFVKVRDSYTVIYHVPHHI